MLSPVFGRYRIRLTRRRWRLETGSSLLGGDGDSVVQQELPVQKPGHRSKLTRKEMDDSEDSDDDPAGVSRFSQNSV